MNCPHCQQELPETQTSGDCPYCLWEVAPANAGGQSSFSEVTPIKINVPIFFTALFLPVALTALLAWLTKAATNPGWPMALGFFGGGIGGLIAGIMLALRLGESWSGRVGLSLVFGLFLAAVCIIMCCFGCNACGYQMHIN